MRARHVATHLRQSSQSHTQITTLTSHRHNQHATRFQARLNETRPAYTPYMHIGVGKQQRLATGGGSRGLSRSSETTARELLDAMDSHNHSQLSQHNPNGLNNSIQISLSTARGASSHPPNNRKKLSSRRKTNHPPTHPKHPKHPKQAYEPRWPPEGSRAPDPPNPAASAKRVVVSPLESSLPSPPPAKPAANAAGQAPSIPNHPATRPRVPSRGKSQVQSPLPIAPPMPRADDTSASGVLGLGQVSLPESKENNIYLSSLSRDLSSHASHAPSEPPMGRPIPIPEHHAETSTSSSQRPLHTGPRLVLDIGGGGIGVTRRSSGGSNQLEVASVMREIAEEGSENLESEESDPAGRLGIGETGAVEDDVEEGLPEDDSDAAARGLLSASQVRANNEALFQAVLTRAQQRIKPVPNIFGMIGEVKEIPKENDIKIPKAKKAGYFDRDERSDCLDHEAVTDRYRTPLYVYIHIYI